MGYLVCYPDNAFQVGLFQQLSLPSQFAWSMDTRDFDRDLTFGSFYQRQIDDSQMASLMIGPA